MTPAQIEGMIDRIVGIFPAHNVSRNTMKSTWGQDLYLLSIDVDDARKVMPLVEQHGKIPSLPEMKRMFSEMFNKNSKITFTGCDICNGDGWDTGLRVEEREGVGVVVQDLFTETDEEGVTRTVVKRCACRN